MPHILWMDEIHFAPPKKPWNETTSGGALTPTPLKIHRLVDSSEVTNP